MLEPAQHEHTGGLSGIDQAFQIPHSVHLLPKCYLLNVYSAGCAQSQLCELLELFVVRGRDRPQVGYCLLVSLCLNHGRNGTLGRGEVSHWFGLGL